MRECLIALALTLAASAGAYAGEAQPTAQDPALEAQVQAIAAELRCLVCQNQTIADSQAALAVDLRRQVREMLRQGQDREAVLGYMTARYGDFVRYRPPLQARTAVLWAGPVVLLSAGLLVLGLVLRQRSRLDAAQFEPDPDLDNPDDAARTHAAPKP